MGGRGRAGVVAALYLVGALLAVYGVDTFKTPAQPPVVPTALLAEGVLVSILPGALAAHPGAGKGRVIALFSLNAVLLGALYLGGTLGIAVAVLMFGGPMRLF